MWLGRGEEWGMLSELTLSYGIPSSSRTITTFQGLGPPLAVCDDVHQGHVQWGRCVSPSVGTYCRQQSASTW